MGFSGALLLSAIIAWGAGNNLGLRTLKVVAAILFFAGVAIAFLPLSIAIVATYVPRLQSWWKGKRQE